MNDINAPLSNILYWTIGRSERPASAIAGILIVVVLVGFGLWAAIDI